MIEERQVPSEYQTVNDDLWFVVTSDNIHATNFKFVFDVYVGSDLIARVKRWPVPGTVYGEFNAAEIIRSYLTTNHFNGSTAIATEVDPVGKLYVEFTVEYGEESGGEIDAGVLVSDPIKVFNFYNDLNHSPSQGIENYANKFLTERPRTQTLSRKDRLYLPFWNPEYETEYIIIRSYKADGTPVDERGVAIGYELALVNIGVPALTASYGGLITDEVAYYTVEAGDDLFTINLCDAKLYQHKSVVFCNRFGMYESFTFTGKNRKSVDLERTSFGKPKTRLHTDIPVGRTNVELGSGNVYIGDSQIASVTKKYKYSLSTGILRDEQFEWLGQLVASPMVYLEMPVDGFSSVYYLPVAITNTNYQYMTFANDKANPLTIDVEVQKQFTSQFA